MILALLAKTLKISPGQWLAPLKEAV